MTAPLPSVVAGGAANITDPVAAVHFRDERGFAIFSIEASEMSRPRALGYLAPEIGLLAVVRAVGTWTQHARLWLAAAGQDAGAHRPPGPSRRRGLPGGIHDAPRA